MQARRLGTARQWLLLAVFVLAFAVTGMHHVTQSAAGDGHAATATAAAAEEHHGDGTPEPSPMHSFLHLCLAVLCATAGLLLLAVAILHLRRSRPALRGLPRRTRILGGRDGPAPPYGRQLLASTCVLRL